MANLKDDTERGLYQKFKIERVDGSSEPDRRHYGCRYFVLDLDHDPHAVAALRTYAVACRRSHPHLSDDLIRVIDEIVVGRTPGNVPLAWEDPSSTPLADLRAANESIRFGLDGSPFDIRGQGWDVAVHNDYTLDGRPHTFWLFTKGDRCAKGEGQTDADALNEVREEVMRIERELLDEAVNPGPDPWDGSS